MGFEPAGGEPVLRYCKIGPATVQADAHVWRRRHGWKAKGPRTVPVKANLRRDRSNCIGLTLRAAHVRASESRIRLLWGRQGHWYHNTLCEFLPEINPADFRAKSVKRKISELEHHPSFWKETNATKELRADGGRGRNRTFNLSVKGGRS